MVNKKIFIINGFQRSGKDTFISLVSKYRPSYNYSSIDYMKYIATLCGWKGEKTNDFRDFLHKLKMLTTEYFDTSFVKTCEEIDRFMKSPEMAKYEYMFINIREKSEIDKILSAYDAKTILIRRPNVFLQNTADEDVLRVKYDYTISNDGTMEDFDQKACEFCNMISGGN